MYHAAVLNLYYHENHTHEKKNTHKLPYICHFNILYKIGINYFYYVTAELFTESETTSGKNNQSEIAPWSK